MLGKLLRAKKKTKSFFLIEDSNAPEEVGPVNRTGAKRKKKRETVKKIMNTSHGNGKNKLGEGEMPGGWGGKFCRRLTAKDRLDVLGTAKSIEEPAKREL